MIQYIIILIIFITTTGIIYYNYNKNKIDIPSITPYVTPTSTPYVTPTSTPYVTPTSTPYVTPTSTPYVTPTSTTPYVTPTSTPYVIPTITPIRKTVYGNNGTVSCQTYCMGTGGLPWNFELPSEWNGARCSGHSSNIVDCNSLFTIGPNTFCICEKTGTGWR